MTSDKTNATEFTVGEISIALKRTVEDRFGYVRVRGEISGYRGPHSSGHAYFALKDDKARLEAVIWRGVFSRLAHKPEDGMEIIATGKLTTYPGSSKYQIVIDRIEPAGAGALMAMLEKRRKLLLAEGLFDQGHKKPLPFLPATIGVITSPTGAVIRDILHRLADRFPTRVIVWPVRVQGEPCASDVAAAINGFNALPANGPVPRPDLIIVARGGGSIEDLWGFNEEPVVRAAAESDIPLISAVGHETDTTLIDFAADRRAPTPTGAAEIAVPVRRELVAGIDDLGRRQRAGIDRMLAGRRDRLLAAAAGLPSAPDLLSLARQRHDMAEQKLAASLSALVAAKKVALAHTAPRLSAVHLRTRTSQLAQRVDAIGARLRPAVDRRLETVRQRLHKTEQNLAASLSTLIAAKKVALAHTAPRLSAVHLCTRTSQLAQRVDAIGARLRPAVDRRLEAVHQRLGAAMRLAENLSYLNVLRRGFSLVTNAGGKIVRRAADVGERAALHIKLAEGELDAMATSAPAPRSGNRPKSKPKPTTDDVGGGQSELF
jgi:exodeoxyribonuclease VII large subunit